MTRELGLRLMATPTLRLPNIGLGNLSELSDNQRDELKTLSSLAQRRRWANEGIAMRDGAFPVASVPMLRDALLAYHFTNDKPRAKRWLVRRAREMSRTDLLPEAWGVAPRKAVRAAGDEAVQHTGVMVAIYPTPEVALALAGGQPGDEPPEELHVTLAYMGDMSEFGDDDFATMAKSVEETASGMQPLTAHAQGFGTFVAPDGNNPQWWSIDCVGLAELRTMLVMVLESHGIEPRPDHDFVPHMTIRYGPEGAQDLPPGGDTEWPVDELVLVIGGNRQSFPIGNAAPEMDAETELSLRGITTAEFKANRNNLEEYWKTGEGAASVRWGTPGDFTRCVNHLEKHVGERANRICAQWHHDMNGIWPGDKRNHSVLDYEEGRPMGETITASAAAAWEDTFQYFWNPDTDEVFRSADGAVEAFDGTAWGPSELAEADLEAFPLVDDQATLETIVGAALADGDGSAADVLPEGAGRRFRIPIVIPEGVPSGDRRQFSKNSLEFKEPPMPLLWQKVTDEGHKNSVTVGKITKIERLDGGIGNAEGVFDTHEDAIEAARQVREKFLTGVSGDVDQFEAELSEDTDGVENLEIKHGRLVAATLVAKPAFQEATIEFVTEPGEEEVIVASAGPLHPPKEWFTNPKLDKPTRLDVTDDGRVFGHIAEWGTPHLGNPKIQPPRSRTNYAEFNSRPVRTLDGTDVKTGQLTLVGGHADLDLPAERVIAHYDDTRSAVADVVAGEDEFGIWVAGAMRPTISEEQVRAFRASDPSGDWRQVRGNLELVAVCQVNTPGFPVARALVASAGEEPLALVAAGAPALKRGDAPYLPALVASLEERLRVLETEREAKIRLEAEERIARLRNE